MDCSLEKVLICCISRGSDFSFFDPVFNIADTAISTGVGILLVFNKKAFGTKDEKEAVSGENQLGEKV